MAISTHTPRERRDVNSINLLLLRFAISTHTPRERRDTYSSGLCLSPTAFQLTRLVRGVTKNQDIKFKIKEFQLTRLVRGVTL